MLKVVNLDGCFRQFSDTFTPKIVGELNGQQVKLVHLEGDKVPWHTHDHEDELFLVLDGRLDVREHGSQVTLAAGEFTIVPRGVEHKVVPHGHVRLLLFEPAAIAHTGSVRTDITKDRFDWLNV